MSVEWLIYYFPAVIHVKTFELLSYMITGDWGQTPGGDRQRTFTYGLP